MMMMMCVCAEGDVFAVKCEMCLFLSLHEKYVCVSCVLFPIVEKKIDLSFFSLLYSGISPVSLLPGT